MATKYKDDANAQRDLNAKLKGQTWYQEWAQQNGIDLAHLDGHTVRLTDKQKKSLESLFATNGVVLPDGTKVDTAGQITPKHGFAGQPGWVKAIEIGAALAPVAYLAAPAIAGIGGTAGTAGASTAATGTALGANEAFTTLGALGGVLPGAAKGLSTTSKVASLLGAGGKMVSGAVSAAGDKQYADQQTGLSANAQNISGEAQYQSQLRADAELEAAQRETARKNLYKASVARNPMVSPNNTKGVPTLSPEMMQGLTGLEKEALARLAKPTTYDAATMPAPKPYNQYVPNTKGSTMQTVGNWLAPGLSIAQLLANF